MSVLEKNQKEIEAFEDFRFPVDDPEADMSFEEIRKKREQSQWNNPVTKHAAKYFINKIGNFKIFTYLQIIEPLRPIDILDKCIEQLLNSRNLNSSFAGYEYKNNFWMKNKKGYKLIVPKEETKKPRQYRKKILREDCGAALASRKSVLFKKNKLYSKPFEIISYSGVRGLLDIHYPDDIKLGETLVKKFKLQLK